MSTEVVALALLSFVAVFFGLVKLTGYSSSFRKSIPSLKELLVLLKTMAVHWNWDRKYGKSFVLLYRMLTLSTMLALKGPEDLRNARVKVRALVGDLHEIIHPDDLPDQFDMDVAVAAYMFIISNEEVADLLDTIQKKDYSNLEVKKATILAIDVIGELVARDTKLSQQYFQQVIYGINKTLRIIRDKGTDKKAIKKVVATLFRIYQLTKAYRFQRGLKNLTEVQFYEKVISMFGTLRKYYGGDE